MTDIAQTDFVAPENGVTQVAADSVHDQSVTDSSATQEKMLSQSEVNKLIGITKKKVREEVMQQYEQNAQAQQSSQSNGLDENKLRQLIAEENAKAQQQQKEEQYKQQVNSFAQNFASKMEAAKVKYPQLDQSFNELNLINNHPLLNALNSVGPEDMGGVINELHQNPDALSKVNDLLRTAPAMAHKSLHRIAASIKANEAAKQTEESYKVSEPLSQMSPSMANSDSGKRSATDWANYYRGKV